MATTPTAAARSAKRNNRLHSNDALQGLREQVATMKDDVRNLALAGGDVVRERFDPIRTYIQEKPAQALLIAGGVGLVLGFIFSRR